MIKKIYSLLGKRDKVFFKLLICFSIFIALVEMIGISAIMPFISIASDFSVIHSNQYYSYIYKLLNISNELDFILLFGVVLIFFYIFRGVLNYIYIYAIAKFANGRYHLFSYRLMESYLGMSYKKFVSKNSSELTKVIINEAQNLSTILSSLLSVISEFFVLIIIYSMMLYVDYIITITITVFLMLNGWFFIVSISKKIKRQGFLRESFQKKFYKIIGSTFGNFKFIKLLSQDNIILNEFEQTSSGFALSNIKTQTLYHVPRLLVESLAFILVIMIIMYLLNKNNGDISTSVSVLSMFILGLYRLMPSVNRIISGYNIIVYNYRALDIVHADLMYKGEELGDDKITFNDELNLKNVDFKYANDKEVLKNINLCIKKGDKIAFIGPSGSGKSTLIDIIIGLYRPYKGYLEIDNIKVDNSTVKSLRKKIGYIPQSVYLFDGTVAENISFGNEYNEYKIKDVLKKAKILDFLETLQDGIYTFVGEGGIKLSGGQKQRIAIARALYQNPEILVLDEATSALDDTIEKEIMDEIYEISQNKTLIIIAHRLSTINRCEKVYKIENNKLVLECCKK